MSTVVLHVYEFAEMGERTNRWLGSMSVGVLHSSVEVKGAEYMFCDQGIVKSKNDRYVHKESIEMGTFQGSVNTLNGILRELREKFAPGSYSLTSQNCNHFSDAFVRKLVGVGIPTRINRAASFGAFFATSWWSSKEDGQTTPKRSTEKKQLTEKQRQALARMKK